MTAPTGTNMVLGQPAVLPQSGVAVASGDYSAADPAPVTFEPTGAVGLTIVTDITAISGAGAQIVVNIEGFDPASGKWILLLASAALTATGTTVQIVDPRDATLTANVTAQKPLFGLMRVRPVKSGTTTTLTYSIGVTASM